MSNAPTPSTSTTPTPNEAAPRRPIIHNLPGASRQTTTASATTSSGTNKASTSGVSTVPAKSGSTVGPAVVRRTTLNSILVNVCQKGNPVLSLIRTVPWEYSEIVPDYQVGATSGVLFLSLKYHRLHPEYVHNRIAKLGKTYQLRIMMVLCDVDDHETAIRELTKTCVVNEFTMMVAWSNAELARYLELYKSFERKAPDLIKERVDEDYLSRLTGALTNVRGVNKTDVVTLASNFGSLKRMATASADELTMCPGLGEKKVKRLREAFSAPFVLRSKPPSEAEKKGKAGNALN